MRHCGINAATAIPPTDNNAMMKEKALVACMSRHDMVDGDSNWGHEESSCMKQGQTIRSDQAAKSNEEKC